MQVDDLITLKNNQKYALLLEENVNGSNYFLAVLVNESEEPTNKYAVLKHSLKDNKDYVKRENDVLILDYLLKKYQVQNA